MKLNLGCGKRKLEGYVNCDIDPRMKPDKIVDLTKRLPFKSNSVDEIFTSHTLEHIDLATLVNVTLPEMWRVCKPDAKVKIIVPYLDAQPVLDHKVRFHEDTFKNWCKETYESTGSFPFSFSFEIIKIEFGKSKTWGWLYR